MHKPVKRNFEGKLQSGVLRGASSSLWISNNAQGPHFDQRWCMWTWPQNALHKHTHTHTVKMFCFHSLMLISLEDYTFWEQWFPRVKVSARFHVSVKNPAASWTQSFTCCVFLASSPSSLHFSKCLVSLIRCIMFSCPVVSKQYKHFSRLGKSQNDAVTAKFSLFTNSWKYTHQQH